MRQKPNRLFSRVAAMLLMMMFTTATAWAETVETYYVDANGTRHYVTATVLTGNETSNQYGQIDLPAGWYVVNSNISYTVNDTGSGKVFLAGDVNIILANGCTMNIGTSGSRQIGIGINGYFTPTNLTIYGQSLDEATAGQLSIYTDAVKSANGSGILIQGTYTQHSGNVTINSPHDAISVNGDITINGGKLDATTKIGQTTLDDIYALRCTNNITMNGGILNAIGNSSGHAGKSANGIYGTVTMTGGTLTAFGITDGDNSIGIEGDVTFSGGTLTATSTATVYDTPSTGISGNVSLSWTSAADRFTASSFAGGTVTIASGKAFTDGTDIYSGTLSSDDLTAIAGKTLVPQTETFYQRVTDVSQLESGKRYFIVAKQSETYYAWARFNSDFVTTTEISANSSGIITSVGDAAHMQLVQSGEKWKIIDCSTNQYVGVKGGANKLQESSDSDSDSFLWNISFYGSGTLKVHIGEKYLKFIKNITLTAFSIYGESEQTDISIYKEVLIPGTSLTLYDGIDNTAMIGEAATIGGTFNVTLKNRVLYKDGDWNTLCLPFAVGEGEAASGHELDGTPLEGATLMTLGNSQGCNTGFDATTGTLNLEFLPARTVEPGVPYIVKWDSGEGIENPVFTGVTVTNDAPANHATNSQDGYLTFVGTYAKQEYTTEDKSILFLGTANTLYYPQPAHEDPEDESSAMVYPSIGACRAYFQLNNGLTCGTPTAQVKAFNLSFGEEIPTHVSLPSVREVAGAWYTVDGVRLAGKPTKKGLYIMNGRKFAIK